MKKNEKYYYMIIGIIITSIGYNVYSLIVVESSYSFFKSVENAKYSIDIAVFSFTNMELAKALVEKSKEGVKIRVIVDRNSLDRKAVRYMEKEGIEIRTYDGTMHAKVMIVDSKVIIGSHNYSYSAFGKNKELSVMVNPLLILKVAEIKQWFNEMWEKAKPI